VYFGRKRYILYAFFSFCRFPVYFLRLQKSLCHQPWDLRPRGCLVGSEGRECWGRERCPLHTSPLLPPYPPHCLCKGAAFRSHSVSLMLLMRYNSPM
uniref:Uncharacterized protein n=1 Tax=Spermophilus dauricus TaxID=99837 RepID=A0A8C9Q0S2_SPEDA